MSQRPEHRDRLEELARDLDLLVYRLERPLAGGPDALVDERARVRRELERLHGRLAELVRELD